MDLPDFRFAQTNHLWHRDSPQSGDVLRSGTRTNCPGAKENGVYQVNGATKWEILGRAQGGEFGKQWWLQ